MIQKTVKYEDFDGNKREDSFFFHLTKADLIDWAAEESGGLVDNIMNIAKEEDPLKIIPIMKEIIIRAYGVKTPDGKGFVKDEEDVKNFQYTAAFSELYVELSTDADKAVEFINGILPKFDPETQKQIEEARKQFEKEQEEKEGTK